MKYLALLSCLVVFSTSGCAFKSPPEDYQAANPPVKEPIKPFSPPETGGTAALLATAAGTWQGQLPCADCPGINYRLSLQKDGTYEERSEYQGKTAAPFVAKGNWQIGPDSVVQLTKTSGHTQFKIAGNTLVMLDQKGQQISSGSADKYVLRRANGNGLPASLEAKRQQGIDFVAKGNGGAWNLELNLDKNIVFESAGDRLKLNAPDPTEQKMADNKGFIYRAKTEAGTLTVRLLKQTCTDKASGRTFPYGVEVTANAQSYTGCGLFLQDARLVGTWQLQQLNGKNLKASDFTKGLPTLELQPESQQVSGVSGCNRFTGYVEIKGDKVAFGNLAGTRMACPGTAMQTETEYLGLLSGKTLTYEIEQNRLTLKDQGKQLLVYKKAE
ncbi:META domain-containing protein [Adhaeribacter soli]|nr:META domain-containing protein [Adhaeribacter soli]